MIHFLIEKKKPNDNSAENEIINTNNKVYVVMTSTFVLKSKNK